MIIVRSNDKDKYLSALNKSDIAVGLIPSDGANAGLEQIQPFVAYMKGCLLRALEIRIRAAKGESIEEDNDWRKRLLITHADKINQPECDDATLNDILTNSFKPLLEKIDSELSQFYSIFSHVHWFPGKANYKLNIAQESQREEPVYSSVICFEEKSNATHYIVVLIVFSQFHYDLIIQTRNSFGYAVNLHAKEYTYSKRPTIDDYTAIVNVIGKSIVDFIERPNPFTK